MTLTEFQQIHDFLIELALRGGQMMLDANPTASTSGSKKNCKLLPDSSGLCVATLRIKTNTFQLIYSCRFGHRHRQIY